MDKKSQNAIIGLSEQTPHKTPLKPQYTPQRIPDTGLGSIPIHPRTIPRVEKLKLPTGSKWTTADVLEDVREAFCSFLQIADCMVDVSMDVLEDVYEVVHRINSEICRKCRRSNLNQNHPKSATTPSKHIKQHPRHKPSLTKPSRSIKLKPHIKQPHQKSNQLKIT
ncbi:hypothetical protein Dimus_037950 [Dionaea muscipula]